MTEEQARKERAAALKEYRAACLRVTHLALTDDCNVLRVGMDRVSRIFWASVRDDLMLKYQFTDEELW